MATLSAKETAREIGCDARTFRKFMRATLPKEEQPGQGNRYNIESKDLKKLKKSFAEWQKPKAKATSSNGSKAEAEVIDITDEDVADFEDLDLEPSDEDIDDFEDLEDLEELD